MKFTYAAICATLVVCAAAQTSSAPAPVQTTPPTKTELCLKTCDGKPAGELDDCRAQCMGNPHPTEEQVNQNTKCVADCPQGKGSPEDTKKYTDCVNGCVTKYFMPEQTTDGTSDDTPSTSDPSQSGESHSPSPTGTTDYKNKTNTNSTESAKPTGGSAASSLGVSISFAGTFAIIAGLFAL